MTLDYSELFRTYIANGLDTLLEGIKTAKFEDETHSDSIVCSLEMLRFALKTPSAWPKTRELLLALSPQMEQQGHWSEWLPYLHSASHMAEELKDLQGFAKLSMWAAVINHSMGCYEEAREGLRNCANQFSILGDKSHSAHVLNLLAWTERLAGNLDEALHLVSDALLCLQDDEDDELLERAKSYSILGAIAYEKEEWTQAEYHFRKTLQVTQLTNDKRRRAWGYADVGLALSVQGKYEESLANYQAAMEVIEDINAPVQTAVFQMNLAGIYLRLKKPSEALNLCRQGHEVFQRVHDMRRLIMAEINIGIAHYQLAQFDEAKHVLLSASGRAERLNYHGMRFSALYQLGQVYLGSCQYQEAITTFQMALLILENAESSERHENHREEVLLQLREAKAALEERDNGS